MNSTQRITVVDSLRGFAVCGIILIHFMEHMNFYAFPEQAPFNQTIWDTVWFLGSSKMYAIFALLFGFSCFIQHHNQEVKGYDFRPRFAWRMVLLFIWGLLDLMFYNGDILGTYAAMGLLMIPLVKAPDKVLKWIAIFLFLQPVELIYMILGSINPELHPLNTGIGPLWGILYDACGNGSILDVAKAGLQTGLQVNFGWAIENGRLTQTLMLFIIGFLLGRHGRFMDTEENTKFWKKVLVTSLVAFAVFLPLWKTIPGLIENRTVANSADTLLNMWRNFAMTCFYVSGITLLYYRTKAQKAIFQLSYIGKMSLTDYLLQSIVGGFIFYNWGLHLYDKVPHYASLLIAVAFLFALYFFCRWWTTHHKRGPLEEIWTRLTWIGGKR